MPPRPRSSGPYARQATSTGLWSAQYRDRSGHKHYVSGYSTKKAAQRAALIEEERERAGGAGDPRGRRTTYEAWAVDRWWPTRPVTSSTPSDYGRLMNVVIPRWGDLPLEDFVRARLDVQAWVLSLVREPSSTRGRPYAASTARHCYHLLSASLRAAVAEGIIPSSPCIDVRLPELPIGEDRYLTDHEIDLIFDGLDGAALIFCEVMLDAGLRPGELAGLHRHRVHLDPADPYVSVIETFDAAERVIRPQPKGKRRRDVPLSIEAADRLRAWWATAPDPGSCSTPHVDGSRCRHSLAIASAAGTPIDRTNLSNRDWARAVLRVPSAEIRIAREARDLTITEVAAAAGITPEQAADAERDPDESNPGLRRLRRALGLPPRGTSVMAVPYDLRHTYASRCLTAGIPAERLQDLMGHDSWLTTQGYARFMNTGRDDVRAKLAARREAAREADPHRRTPTAADSDTAADDH